jgi:hypothetical protein
MASYYPGFQITSWGGLCGPAGLPPAMVAKASALTKQALASDAPKTVYLGQGATAFWMGRRGGLPPRRGKAARAHNQAIRCTSGLNKFSDELLFVGLRKDSPRERRILRESHVTKCRHGRSRHLSMPSFAACTRCAVHATPLALNDDDRRLMLRHERWI